MTAAARDGGRLPLSFVFFKEPLEQKAGKEPAGQVVQTDEPVDMPAGTAVIPGTQIFSGQQFTADIFSRKDERGVSQSPYNGAFVF